MSALDGVLGRPGEPVACRPGEYISAHWWPGDAAPGDPCLCGAQRKRSDDVAGVERDTETDR